MDIDTRALAIVEEALDPWYREQDAIVARHLARKRSGVWTDKLGEAKFNLSGTLADLPGRGTEAWPRRARGSRRSRRR